MTYRLVLDYTLRAYNEKGQLSRLGFGKVMIGAVYACWLDVDCFEDVDV